MCIVLGITGGSGCGKSAASAYLHCQGAYIIDADQIARQIMEPGMLALAKVAEAFPGVLRGDGELDRKKLAELVFHDSKKLQTLNQITHTYIIQEIKERLASFSGTLAVIDAPLLLEANLDALCHATIFVFADHKTRLSRIIKRDGLTTKAALARINAQKPDDYYRSRCRFVIENNTTLSDLHRALDSILKELLP